MKKSLIDIELTWCKKDSKWFLVNSTNNDVYAKITSVGSNMWVGTTEHSTFCNQSVQHVMRQCEACALRGERTT